MYDYDFIYEQNFYLCITEEAKELIGEGGRESICRIHCTQALVLAMQEYITLFDKNKSLKKQTLSK